MKKEKEISHIPKVATGTSPQLAKTRGLDLLRKAEKDRIRRMNKIARRP